LPDNQLEVFAEPQGAADQADYRDHRIYSNSDEAPVIIEGREVARLAVRDLLP
jgi:hypothetical protein